MFCTKCGNQLRENARFCPKCGAPVRAAQPPVAVAAAPAPKPAAAQAPQTAAVQTPQPAAVQTPQPAAVQAPQPAPVQAPQPAAAQAPQPAAVHAPASPVTPVEPAKTEQTASEVKTEVKQEVKVETTQEVNAGVKQEAKADIKQEAKQEEKQDAKDIFRFRAPNVKGEAVLGELKRAAASNAEGLGPGQVIISSFKSFFTSLVAFVKNPLVLIPSLLFTLALPAFWMLLNILQANGINPWPLKFLSFLSCANGGMSGGIFGGFGGIIGKGVFVAGIVTLISLIFRKKGSTKRSFGEILKGSFGVSRETLGVYFTGIGIAFLLYLFITGGATRISALCGIAAMIITATSALNNGFTVRFINSLTAKGKHSTGQAGAGLMRGFTVGYAVSAILGFITGTRIIPVILAIHFLIAGAVFIILQITGVIKPKKGAAV